MGDLPTWRWWSHYDGWPTQMKCWSHCNGWPTQEKDVGLIMMGDLPKWKKWWSHYDGWPTQMEDNGLIMMGDLPRWKMVSLWWVTYPKKDGLILMGDLPKWRWWSHYDGWPTQMKDDGEGSKAHSKGGRVRKRTTWEVRAQRRTQKEVGLANALPKRWWLKGTLGMR